MGEELAAGLGVVDCLADLGADEVGGRVVCGLVRHEVGERSADEVEAALDPLLLVQLVALSLGVVQGGTLHRVQMAAAVAPACLLEDCLVVRFDLFLDEPTVRRPVTGGHGELGRALEDREAAGLPGDDWNRLHAAGAGAYDRHAFSRKVDGVVRPGAGVVPVALEGLQPLDPGDVARGYAADAGDEVPGGYPVAVVGLDLPQVGFFAEGGGRDAGVELDVATQVEAVGDVVEVGEDLRLLGVFAAPAPFLEQLLREREAVDVALGVAAGAGVAVPVPGAADAAAGFVDLDGEAHHVPQTPQHPHAREAGSDYYGIEVSAILQASHLIAS